MNSYKLLIDSFLEYGRLEMRIFFVTVIGRTQVNSHHQHLMIHYMLVVHMQSKINFIELFFEKIGVFN
jgi:hypothetical protein